MQRSLILLTGEIEQLHLSQMMEKVDPDLKIIPAGSHVELEEIVNNLSEDELKNTRLVAYCVDVIVKPEILNKLPNVSYNFHPGPPNYPGSFCAQFAIYEDAPEYGVTFHEINEKVDEGRIIDMLTFNISDFISDTEVESLAYRELAILFLKLSSEIANVHVAIEPKVDVEWSGTKRGRAEWLEIKNNLAAK